MLYKKKLIIFLVHLRNFPEPKLYRDDSPDEPELHQTNFTRMKMNWSWRRQLKTLPGRNTPLTIPVKFCSPGGNLDFSP